MLSVVSFPSALARAYPVAPEPVGPPSAPLPPLPPLSARGRHAVLWVVGLLAFLALVLAAYFLEALGPVASVIGMVVALIPLAAVLLAVRYVDRWEPEPRGLMALAVAWGAIAAAGIALGVDLLVRLVMAPGDSAVHDAMQAVVQAPLAEETAKGLGVLLIALFARRAFDGPVDGIVYGALVAAGFAFTENIQYFAVSVLEGGAGQLTATFILRGLLSPFAHVMFTSVTGFALGLTARRGARTRATVGVWTLGVLGAACLHAVWNASAQFFDFFVLYTTLQVPLFVLFVVGVVLLRREEQRLTRRRLGDYAAAGWFTPHEIDMLATPHGRHAGMAWARTLGADRSAVMKAFIADATRLAAVRQRILTGRDPHAADAQQVLLARTEAARRALLAA